MVYISLFERRSAIYANHKKLSKQIVWISGINHNFKKFTYRCWYELLSRVFHCSSDANWTILSHRMDRISSGFSGFFSTIDIFIKVCKFSRRNCGIRCDFWTQSSPWRQSLAHKISGWKMKEMLNRTRENCCNAEKLHYLERNTSIQSPVPIMLHNNNNKNAPQASFALINFVHFVGVQLQCEMCNSKRCSFV